MATRITDSGDIPTGAQQRPSWLRLVLHDVHFWVPVAVLVGGLLVLRWIS